ncbi:hypothetical protein [Arhodomonas sp. AD133]|uniref:hypothetical protein n=1 Tax=Arhodomonas sp. AD133 TaxID=3415009 RepID=UPI003EBBC1CD
MPLRVAAITLSALVFSLPAMAEDTWRSPLRPGLELTTELSEALDVRFGVNASSESDSGWRGDVQTQPGSLGASALVDWQFSGNSGMRLTGGALYGDTSWSWQKGWQPGGESERLGVRLDEDASLTPYVGFGWDQQFGEGQRFGLQLDLGVMFEGVGDLDSGTSELRELREETQLGERFESFRYVPMFSAGVEYRF